MNVSIFMYLMTCFVDQIYNQFWIMFHEVLIKYIILCLGEIFCRYVRSISVLRSISFFISLFIFCLDKVSICESVVFNSITISTWDSQCDLRFSNVFINVGALVYGHRCSELKYNPGRFVL